MPQNRLKSAKTVFFSLAYPKDFSYFCSMKHAAITFLVTTIVLFSCQQSCRYDTRLLAMDSLLRYNESNSYLEMKSRIDSIRNMLSKLEPDMRKADKENRMFYTLLCNKALLAWPDTIPDSDSAIQAIIKHYEHTGNKQLKLESSLIATRYYMLMRNDSLATHYGEPAFEQAMREGDSEKATKLCDMLNHCFISMKQQSRCVDLAKKLLHWNEQRRDTPDIANSLVRLANAYSYTNHRYDTRTLLRKAIHLGEESRDTNTVISAKLNMAFFFVTKHQYDSALIYLRPSINIAKEKEQTGGFYTLVANIYKGNGMLDSAEYYFNKAIKQAISSSEKIISLDNLSVIALNRWNIEQGLSFRRALETYRDSIRKDEGKKRLQVINQENNRLRQENNSNKYYINILLVVALAMAFILFVILLFRKRNRTTELNTIEPNTHNAPNKTITHAAIYQRIMGILNNENSSPLTDEDWKELAEAINACHPHFTENLHDLCKMNAQEYHICLLLKCNISPSNIALLTNRSKEAITAARRRLYERAKGGKGTPSDWDLIIKEM